MAHRRGPEDGYDFGNKRRYRRDVWGCFRKHGIAPAMLMPSLEGDEIIQAMRRGWREDQLHIVDRNPAIVATLKKRYPSIHTYGIDLERAVRRAGRDRTEIQYINADLCCPVNLDYVRLMSSIRNHLPGAGFVATTVLRGREDRRTSTWLDRNAVDDSPVAPVGGGLTRRKLTSRDGARLELLAGALMSEGYVVTLERAAIYRSTAGTQTMLWAIFRRRRLLASPAGMRASANLVGDKLGRLFPLVRNREAMNSADRVDDDWPSAAAQVSICRRTAVELADLLQSLRSIRRRSDRYLSWIGAMS